MSLATYCQLGALGKEQYFGGLAGALTAVAGMVACVEDDLTVLVLEEPFANALAIVPVTAERLAKREALFEALKKDPELGEDLPSTLSHCLAAARAFDVPDLQALLFEADFDVDPRVLRFVARVGASVCPDCAQARKKGKVRVH